MHRFGLLVVIGLVGCSSEASKTVQSADAGRKLADAEVALVDADQDGYPSSLDCNDEDSAVHPDAPELCNGVDDDCDGAVDADDDDIEGATFYYSDGDQDGFGRIDSGGVFCEQPPDSSPVGTDCNDDDELIHPDAVELCDEVDNNCDGLADDEAPSAEGKSVFYVDDDGDGYGDPLSVQTLACNAPLGMVLDATDCNDLEPASNPGMDFDFDDDIDNDCDTSTDENVGDETYSHNIHIQSIWDEFCISCHGSQGGLTLTNAYGTILGGSSAGIPYIRPGLPQASYLWLKLTGAQGSVNGSGDAMPPGSPPLSTSDLARIETWINEGAVQ